MSTQHTAGPWTINGNIGRKNEIGVLAGAAPCIIAVMGNQREWPAEAQANARLIAAAPELLAALEMTMRAFDVEEIDPFVAFATIKKARAAIAKAR